MESDSTRALTWAEAARLWVSWGGIAEHTCGLLDLPDGTIVLSWRAGRWRVSVSLCDGEWVDTVTRDLLEEIAEHWGMTAMADEGLIGITAGAAIYGAAK